MKFKICICLSLLNLAFSVNHEKRGINPSGPFFIPEMIQPKVDISRHSTSLDVYIVPEKIKVLMVTCRAWRKARNWKFLASYHYETNSYVVVPSNEEALKWINEKGAYIGEDFIDSGDEKCWTDLSKVQRNKLVKENKKLNPVEPSATAFRSKCTTTWSVDIHEVEYPLYFKWENDLGGSKDYKIIFYGPTGTEFRVDSKKEDVNVIRVEDTVLTYHTIVHNTVPTIAKAMCLDDYCIVTYEKGTMSLQFKGRKSEYQNYGFYDQESIPSSKKGLMKASWDSAPDADPVTFQDFKVLVNDLDYELKLLEETRISLQLESARVNNLMKAVVSSVSKIDDQLIGEIINRPMRSKWINHEDFLLYNSFEMNLGATEKSKNNNCVGSYIFKGGRWKLNEGKQGDCFDWVRAEPLSVIAPLTLANLNYSFKFTNFRKSDNSYDGWTFLDDGKASLDDFDSRVRDKPGASLFGDMNFGNNLLFYIEIAGIAFASLVGIYLLMDILKTLK